MHLLLMFDDGSSAEAMLLASNGDRMRIAIQDQEDATDLCRVEGRWVCEDTDTGVEFGALIRCPGSDLPAGVRPMAAGFSG